MRTTSDLPSYISTIFACPASREVYAPWATRRHLVQYIPARCLWMLCINLFHSISKLLQHFFFFIIKVYYSVKSKQHRNNLLADQIIDCAIFFETLVIKGKSIVMCSSRSRIKLNKYYFLKDLHCVSLHSISDKPILTY